jgi:Ca-activated chloride channel family protein
MQFTAQLDVDVVALEAEDEVTCLVSLTAPVPEEIADRPGETLIAVVDRSGSMDGGPIEAVRTALHQLVDRLKPQDRFGVVVFDSEALVQVPYPGTAEPSRQPIEQARQALEALHARRSLLAQGSTSTRTA